MGIYDTSGAFNAAVDDTTGVGRYSASGALRVKLVSGTSYVGLYAADGSMNVILDSSGQGLYHPSGAVRGVNISSGQYGLYAPNGAYYFSNLVVGPTPATLFTAGEAGVWYDPSDFSTMFQDVGGTTPVTAVGQSVALIRDKSRANSGSPLGTELITNGDFSVGTGWTLGPSWSIASGSASRAVFGGGSSLSQAITLTAGKSYYISFDVTAISGGTIFPRFTGGTNVSGITVSATGSYSQVLVAVTGNTTFNLLASVNAACTVDNVSVKEILTSDAFQTLSASCPVLGKDGSGNYYLDFDGVDDWLVSQVDMSGTDAMTFWTGFERLSDATTGMLCELSRNMTNNNGSIFFSSLITAGTASNRIASRGTVQAGISWTGVASPVKYVASSSADISADTIDLRMNGTQVGTSTTDQGTGNYGNQPFFIGRRGDSLIFWFTGHVYSIILLGRTATGTEVTDIETWVNNRTGAY